jgi:hypothetical protein
VHFWKELSEYLKLRENIYAGEEEILDYHFDLLQQRELSAMVLRLSNIYSEATANVLIHRPNDLVASR